MTPAAIRTSGDIIPMEEPSKTMPSMKSPKPESAKISVYRSMYATPPKVCPKFLRITETLCSTALIGPDL